ncbi:hypothetical protein [Actinophytocola oryzae]|uniref:Uncharacterized protein n=1 Tax=Actinophytocola oryzae TaxID=502181 RepID=A0A4R7V9C0_9PSEU|nr:hypothetical protein [Actinophytocola oryzae]TDV45518.1 hypothetical protein CLV71_112187 [Actinophytocola oryzae]
MTWTWSDVIAVAGVAIGVVAIVASAIFTRRWGTLRGKLRLEYECTRLLTRDGASDQLKISYRDVEVPDPYVVTIKLTNVGQRDLTSVHFDNGQPLKVDLGCKMYGLLESSGSDATPNARIGAIGSAGVVEFMPSLLKRKKSWEVTALVSGSRSPRIESPLVDIDVVRDELIPEDVHRTRSRVSKGVYALMGALLIIGAALFVVDIVTRPDAPVSPDEIAYCQEDSKRTLSGSVSCVEALRQNEVFVARPLLAWALGVMLAAGPVGGVAAIISFPMRRRAI